MVVVSNRIGSSVIVLRAIRAEDALVQSPLRSHQRDLTFVSIRPVRSRQILTAIRSAGFDVQVSRRWYFSGTRPID